MGTENKALLSNLLRCYIEGLTQQILPNAINVVFHMGLLLLATPNLTGKLFFLVNIAIMWPYNCTEGANSGIPS